MTRETTVDGADETEGATGVIRAGMALWVRERMLPRLVPIGPEEIDDVSRAGRLRVLRRLFGALRGERARGRSGHWSYSLDRHIGLVQAVAAERQGFLEATGEPFAFTRHRERIEADPPTVSRGGAGFSDATEGDDADGGRAKENRRDPEGSRR